MIIDTFTISVLAVIAVITIFLIVSCKYREIPKNRKFH
jgi:heme/copper-type cytochrome/quinol oxidase subunit 2